MPFVKNLTNQAQVLKYTQQLTKAKKNENIWYFFTILESVCGNFCLLFVYGRPEKMRINKK